MPGRETEADPPRRFPSFPSQTETLTGTGRRPPPPGRQPVVLGGPGPSPSRGARCAEVAGGTAADCAACCCCPCGLVGLVVLAVVKVPAALCRKAFLRQKKKMGARLRRRGGAGGASATRAGLLATRVGGGEDREGGRREDDDDDVASGGVGWPAAVEVTKMEEELWARFYGGGFWRSHSQREM
uniref:Tectonic-1 n=1 Tax=Anthurium amnicola TaxID=1678845 RepID=A0A1D1XPT0_9ARAE